jgi:maltoporin
VLLKGSSATSTAPKGSGQMLFLEHTQNGVLGGFNKVALVLGKDQGAAFEWLPTFQSGGEQKGRVWRIHDHLYFDFKGTPWTGTATTSYATWTPEGASKLSWFSFGARPQYNFANTQLALSRGVWARPVLRAFVTYAKWNGVAQKAGIANGVFGDSKNGMNFGVEPEARW